VAAAVVELLHRAHQAERPLLHEVGEREPVAVALVALGDVHDQAQVGLDEVRLGGEVAPLDATGELELLGGREQARATDPREEQGEAVDGRGIAGLHDDQLPPRGLRPPQMSLKDP